MPGLRDFKYRLARIIRCAVAGKEINADGKKADGYQHKSHHYSQFRHDILQTRKPISLRYTKDGAEGWMAAADVRDVRHWSWSTGDQSGKFAQITFSADPREIDTGRKR